MSRELRRKNAEERGRRKNAPDERERNRVRGAVAFARWRAHARAGPPADALDAKTELAALANALQVRCIRAVSHCISCIS